MDWKSPGSQNIGPIVWQKCGYQMVFSFRLVFLHKKKIFRKGGEGWGEGKTPTIKIKVYYNNIISGIILHQIYHMIRTLVERFFVI